MADGSQSHQFLVTVLDQHSNAVPFTSVSFTASHADSPGTPVTMGTNSEGVASFNLVTELAGEWTVTAEVDDGPVNGSGAEVRFAPTGPYPWTSFMWEPLEAVTANESDVATVTAMLFDARGYPVGGSVEFIIPSGLSVAEQPGLDGPNRVQVTAGPDGVASIDLISKLANAPGEAYVVEAYVDNGQLVRIWEDHGAGQVRFDGKVRVRFEAGPAVASESQFEIAPVATNPVANNSDTHRLRATARDGKGNPVSGVPVQFTTALDGSDLTTRGPVTTGPDGVAELDWSTTKAGTYQVRAYVEQDGEFTEIPSSPKNATFTAGQPLPDNSWLIEPDHPQRATDQLTLPVGVRIRDANGNNVSGQPVIFGLSAGLQAEGGDGSAQYRTATGDDGVAWVHVYSDQAARRMVTAHLVNEDGGIGFTIWNTRDATEQDLVNTNGQATVVFIPPFAPLSAEASSLTAAPAVRTAGTDPFTLTAHLVGEDDEPFTQSVTVDFSVKGSLDVSFSPAGQATNGSEGTAVWKGFSPDSAGTYQVQATVDGQVLGDPVTVQVVAAEVSALGSWLVEPGGSAAADGQTFQRVGVRAHDAFGNRVTTGDVLFEIPAGLKTATGVEGRAQVSVQVGPDGAAWLDLATEVAASATDPHLVKASVGGVSVQMVMDGDNTELAGRAGQVHLVYTPGPAVAARSQLTLLTADDVVRANNEDSHRFQVEARDRYGNLASGGQVLFTAMWDTELDGPSETVAITEEGLAVFELKVTRAGPWTVTAQIGGTAVDGSGQEAQFVAGPVSVDRSGLLFDGSDGPVAADGGTPHSAWLTVVDAFGNPVNGQAVDFELVGPTGAWFPDAVDGGTTTPSGGRLVTVTSPPTGEVRIDLVNNQVETVLLKVRIGQAELGQKSYDFEAFGPSAAYSSWQVTPTGAQPADGSGWFEAVVTVRDATSEHALVGEGVVVSFDAPPAVLFSRPGPYTTTSEGTVTVGLSSQQVGNWPVTALVGGGQVGDLVTLRFVAGTPVAGPGLSRLVSPLEPSKAGGSEQQTIDAYVTDGGGNPVIDAVVVFTVPPGVEVVGGGLPGSGLSGGEVSRPVNGDGVASLVLVSQTVNTYPVTAQVGDVALSEDGGPAAARFVNADLSYVDSTVAVVGGVRQVDSDPYPVTVSLVDEAGNAYLPATEVVFSYQLEGQSAWTEAARLTATGGSVTWTGFTSQQAGTHQVKAETNTHQLGTTQTATLTPGPVAPNATLETLTVGGPAAANGRTTLPVWMTAVDAYGNPVNGVELGFEFQYPGSEGPVFQTSGTKAAVGTSGPDGRVTVQAISFVEGEFPVRAQVGDSLSPAPYPVALFAQVIPDAAKSEFSVTRSPANASPEAAIADERDSYQVSITVRDPDNRPAPGVGGIVSFTTPAGVTTPIPFAGGGGASAGQATVLVTSPIAGVHTVSVTVDNQPVATQPGGSQYSVAVRFVPGAPASGPDLSRLSAPATSASADGVDTQVVRAYVLDANRNALDGAQVTFTVPAGTVAPGAIDGQVTVTAGPDGVADLAFTSRTPGEYAVTVTANGVPITQHSPASIRFEDRTPPARPTVGASAGEVLAGTVHESDLADAATGTLTAVVLTAADGAQVASCPVDPTGGFTCQLPGFEHGVQLHAHIDDAAGNRSEPAAVAVDREAPTDPRLQPSDGAALAGSGSEPGNSITVTDQDSATLCSLTVPAGGAWQCTLTPAATPGDLLTITETDQAGNVTEVEWRVGLPVVELLVPDVSPGETQSAQVEHFQPWEDITAVMYSDPLELGVFTADENGQALITWTVPNGTPAGQHTVEVAGVLSGSVRATFLVRGVPGGGTSPGGDPNAGQGQTGSGSGKSGTGRDLPTTGTRSAAFVPVAGLLVAIGVILHLVTLRRRRTMWENGRWPRRTSVDQLLGQADLISTPVSTPAERQENT
ncbi:MAG: Ig-like domain-containing protein [Bifidobacteriaceae bacterium]|nr:Ig-like domain-containing protein [Bifidobacteriaceae bacterium]